MNGLYIMHLSKLNVSTALQPFCFPLHAVCAAKNARGYACALEIAGTHARMYS